MASGVDDNWIHRSAGMQCHTCMWFVPKARAMPPGMALGMASATTSPATDLAPDPRSQQTPAIGRCRRHAPTMQGFPVVYASDWCGDHKLDETKA